MTLKILLLKSLIILFVLSSQAQNSVTLYLDSDFNTTEIENASFVRKVIIHDDHYFVTDMTTNGSMVNYGEYKSVNPWIEDGLSKHYDDKGNAYSEGNYLNGDFSGKWVYYKNGKADTVDYNLDFTANESLDCEKIRNKKIKKQLEQIIKVHSDSIINFINHNFHFPARTKSQISNFHQVIQLVLDVDGTVKCIHMSNYIHVDLSMELLRILLKYKSKAEVLEPLPLQLTYSVTEENIKDGEAFTVVEEAPKLIYKTRGIYEYISDSLRIPDTNCKGRAMVHFIVEPDGRISNISIMQGIDNCPGYAQEIERLLKTMPRWIPGKQKGVAVRVKMNAGFNFNRQNNSSNP